VREIHAGRNLKQLELGGSTLPAVIPPSPETRNVKSGGYDLATPTPLFFVSVDSKSFSLSVNPLESTFADAF